MIKNNGCLDDSILRYEQSKRQAKAYESPIHKIRSEPLPYSPNVNLTDSVYLEYHRRLSELMGEGHYVNPRRINIGEIHEALVSIAPESSKRQYQRDAMKLLVAMGVETPKRTVGKKATPEQMHPYIELARWLVEEGKS